MHPDDLNSQEHTQIRSAAEPILVSWPSPQDYNEAVQTPDYTFAEDDLKSGQAELTPLGLPKVATGNFASVYKMRCGESNWALRCFLRRATDQQERYQMVQSALNEMDSKWLVNFAYMAKGIRVNNHWFPALKMEWAEGVPLHVFIAQSLHNRSQLIKLAENFKQMILELQEHGIAHGDLQHGNILVSETDLHLVDYDAVFVPALEGNVATELGHRNYQHPMRTEHHFNGLLDNFSSWVIYISVLCLADDPSLWQLLDGGDECLIFRQRDFANPTESRAFRICEKSANQIIRLHSRFLRSLISLPLDEIPALTAPIEDPVDLPSLARNQTRQSAGRRSPSWIPAVVFCLLLLVVAAANFVLSRSASDEPTLTTETYRPHSYLSPMTQRAIDAQEEQAFYYAAELYKKAIEELNTSPKKHAKEIAECWHQMAHCQYEFNKKQAMNSIAKAQELYSKLNDPIQFRLTADDFWGPQDMNSPHRGLDDYHWSPD
jgi:hypothetical protein